MAKPLPPSWTSKAPVAAGRNPNPWRLVLVAPPPERDPKVRRIIATFPTYAAAMKGRKHREKSSPVYLRIEKDPNQPAFVRGGYRIVLRDSEGNCTHHSTLTHGPTARRLAASHADSFETTVLLYSPGDGPPEVFQPPLAHDEAMASLRELAAYQEP